MRVKIYKLGSYEKYDDSNPTKFIIDYDLESTKYMYVILSGSVTLFKKDYDLGVELPLINLKAGDCFGDNFIQSNTIKPDNLITKNKHFASADINPGSCHIFKFDREIFLK